MLANDLAKVIYEAGLFACRDDSLPTINRIHFEATGKRLVAIATNRFMLGISAADMESDPFSFDLTLEHAEKVRQIARPGRGGGRVMRSAALSLTPAGKKLNVEFGTGESVGVPTFSGDFPSWQQLIGQDPGEVGVIAFNPRYMAVFGKIEAGRGTHMLMQFTSPSKPVIVRVGPDFIGLLMPVRLPDEADGKMLPEWLPKQ